MEEDAVPTTEIFAEEIRIMNGLKKSILDKVEKVGQVPAVLGTAQQVINYLDTAYLWLATPLTFAMNKVSPEAIEAMLKTQAAGPEGLHILKSDGETEDGQVTVEDTDKS